MSDDGTTLSVAELTEYCQTQARLLWGRVETLGAEADEILTEIDEDISEVRSRLGDHSIGIEKSTATPSMSGSDATEDEITELEELESELEEKQAIVEAKQARRTAFEELATAYIELAEDLESDVADGQEALTRIVRFEHDNDAPAYFEDRLTILEAASDADET